jgi:transcriptional regulator with XRE-family HTH domain
MSDIATNLRRLIAHGGLTIKRLAEQSGVDQRTIKAILAGSVEKPHARTLHQLAGGLGASMDEFFQNPSSLAGRSFDRQTNPMVDELIHRRPEIFDGWSETDFDELYSHVGVGGHLTAEGSLAAATAINRKREIFEKVAILLETSEAELLVELIECMHRRVQVDGEGERQR